MPGICNDALMLADFPSMLDALTEHEQEVAARSSYKYCIQGGEREPYVLAMARRHWVAEKGNAQLALKKMKSTIQYRQHAKIDEIRRCFYETDNPELAEYRRALATQCESGKAIIRGFDRDGHPLYFVYVRKEMHQGFDAKWYSSTYCSYMLERAIAIAEKKNGGEKVVVVFDYKGFSLGNFPPISVVTQFIATFQHHYPERAHAIYICNAPGTFRLFWNLIKSFIDPDTRSKIHFLTGPSEVTAKFTEIVDAEDAQTFMRPDGKRIKEVDMTRFLYELDFDRDYDA